MASGTGTHGSSVLLLHEQLHSSGINGTRVLQYPDAAQRWQLSCLSVHGTSAARVESSTTGTMRRLLFVVNSGSFVQQPFVRRARETGGRPRRAGRPPKGNLLISVGARSCMPSTFFQLV